MGIQNRSLQIDDEVWGALAVNELSANQLLRLQLGLDEVAAPRKQRTSRLERMRAELAASDVTARLTGRDNIEYGAADTLPQGQHVAHLDATANSAGSNIGKATTEIITPNPRERTQSFRQMRPKGDKTR